MKSIHNPSCVSLHQHLTTEGVDVTELVTEIPEGWTFIRQLPEKGMKDRGLGIDCDVLQSPVGGACSHVIVCGQHVIPWPRFVTAETFDMVLKAAAWTNDSDQCPRALPKSGSRSPPEDDCRKEIDTAGEGPASSSSMSCMGTMVWTHPASSCSHLAAPQMQILQQQHSQGSMHHI